MFQYLFYFLLFIALPTYAADVVVLIPGTWSLGANWHQPGGDFYEQMQASVAKETKLLTFTWSGRNRHKDRVLAAQQLVAFIEKYDEVIFVAHSHGTNVGILASQMLSQRQSKTKIRIFYALGTPVDAEDYLPNMSVIDYFYNLYSYADIIQPVLGAFTRVYPFHERRANISVTLNGKEPSHTTLHHPIIAKWIVSLHDHLHSSQSTFDFHFPYILHFKDNHPPIYEIEYNRSIALHEDVRFQHELTSALTRKKEIYDRD